MHQGVTCTKHYRKQTLNTPAAHTARKLKKYNEKHQPVLNYASRCHMHQTLAQTDPQHTCNAYSPQAETTTKNISLYLVMHQGVTCTKH
jgi:hypothetical protein